MNSLFKKHQDEILAQAHNSLSQYRIAMSKTRACLYCSGMEARDVYEERGGTYRIKCHCGAYGEEAKTGDGAIALWNDALNKDSIRKSMIYFDNKHEASPRPLKLSMEDKELMVRLKRLGVLK